MVKVGDQSTEEKIKLAAKEVFHQKGFAATRTRDIAEAAGINLALLNYYFRSKQKLFDLVMLETFQSFFMSMAQIFNDDKTTLIEKIEVASDRYIDLLIKEPEVPIFLLNELRNHPQEFASRLNLKEILMNSVLFKQLKEALELNKVELHPLQFIMNFMGLIIFPFVGRPVLSIVGNFEQDEFEKLMIARKTLVPIWIKAMLHASK